MATIMLLAGGIYSMLTLPIDAVPDITNNQVQIVTVSPTPCSTGSGTAHHIPDRDCHEQYHECGGNQVCVKIRTFTRYSGFQRKTYRLSMPGS